MKTNKKAVALTVLSGLMLGVGLSGCSTPGPIANEAPSTTNQSVEDIVQEMKDMAPTDGTDAALAWEALTGAEGEFAAAASYQAVLDKFGQVEPYVTILSAEQRHISALTRQLSAFGVDVPSNPYLGHLTAPADLKTAAQAWAEGEILNVALYDRLLAETESGNLTRVFTNLRRSSQESHLPMFELAAEGNGTLSADQTSGMQGSGGMHG